ncbi:uncharacterized protein LOC62_07G009773 [Vanrija pseudolonga]|uniref:Uncharacterized protein n=1 Tax=Vanrija pseudolonga TaxID=143232 RepID=A0AAF1BMI5_9TREE|nr:hypothetical protein LOC62_07G009773 [Vanrija pseudolonga]
MSASSSSSSAAASSPPRFSFSPSAREADRAAGFDPVGPVVTSRRIYLYGVGRYWAKDDHGKLIDVMSVDGFHPTLLPGCKHAETYSSNETLEYETVALAAKVLATWQNTSGPNANWNACAYAPDGPRPHLGNAPPRRYVHGSLAACPGGKAPSTGAMYDELLRFGPIEDLFVTTHPNDPDFGPPPVEWRANVAFCGEEAGQAFEFEYGQGGVLGPFNVFV